MQNEVAWQSLGNGDARPGECFWKLTVASRAAALDGHDTSYLKLYTYPDNMAYVVVLDGHFRSPDYPGKTYATMYLVILKNHDHYVALGFASAPHKLKQLPAMHSYVPQMAVSAGVWGHTLAAGGPDPRRAIPTQGHPGGRLRRIPGPPAGRSRRCAPTPAASSPSTCSRACTRSS